MASLTREDILGDLFYTGDLGYFAQLNTMNRMLGIQGKDNNSDKLNMGYQMGMNSLILESAISEQLFCNETVIVSEKSDVSSTWKISGGLPAGCP